MSRLETPEHIEFAIWLDHNQLVWLHVPNEGERSAATQQLLARMGLKSGAPDFFIFSTPPGSKLKGIAIEMKRVGHENRKKPTNQVWWIATLKKLGWAAEFCHGRDAAVKYMKTLGFTERPLRMLEISENV